MSETTPEVPAPEETPAPEAAPAQNEADLPPWARDAIAKANKEAASYRTRVRELEPKAELADRLEQASKTEQERLQEAAEQARRDAETARADATRYRVAARHGITEDDFDLLGSGSEEEIESRAQRIAAKNQAAAAAVPPPARRPQEALRPGATPGDPKSEDDVLYESLFGK